MLIRNHFSVMMQQPRTQRVSFDISNYISNSVHSFFIFFSSQTYDGRVDLDLRTTPLRNTTKALQICRTALPDPLLNNLQYNRSNCFRLFALDWRLPLSHTLFAASINA